MALLTSPTLSSARAALSAFADVDLRQPAPILTTWRRLTEDLTEDEARELIPALEAITPLLFPDQDRLQLLLDVAMSFDLFELCVPLFDLVRARENHAGILLALASLCHNPGVSATFARDLAERAEDGALSEVQRRAFLLRLEPHARAENNREEGLKAQSWPGLFGAADSGRAPVVAIEDAGATHERLALMGDLVEAGASIRRIPIEWNQPMKSGWLSALTPIVVWDGEMAQRLVIADPALSLHKVVLAPQAVGPYARVGLLREVQKRLSPSIQLREPSLVLHEEAPVLSRDVYRLGAFDLREMVFLSGVPPTRLGRLRSDLPAEYFRSKPFWSFNQLVALRTWHYFRTVSKKRRFSQDVLRSLVQFTGSDEPHLVGVTSAGQVLERSGESLVNVHTGQESIPDFVYLDEVFRPIELGQKYLPSLLDPSPYTKVHPAILGGSPRVAGHRLAARTVAQMERAHGWQAVQNAYPEVGTEALTDAVELGANLLVAV